VRLRLVAGHVVNIVVATVRLCALIEGQQITHATARGGKGDRAGRKQNGKQ